MRPSERIAGVYRINVNAEMVALDRCEHRMDVEKRKAKRLKPEQPQNREINQAWPPTPQRRQRRMKVPALSRVSPGDTTCAGCTVCEPELGSRLVLGVCAWPKHKLRALTPCKDPAMRLDGLLSVVYSSFTIFEYASMG